MRQRVRDAGALLLMLLVACRAEPLPVVEVEVAQVGFDAAAGAPVVVLEAADARRLPIWIGPAEADAIARELQDVAPPRPMTHDLLLDVLVHAQSTLVRVRITELRDQTFYAVLELERAGRRSEIDCRPSDAIALALRAGAPIVVHPGLLERAAPEAERRSAGVAGPAARDGSSGRRLTKFRAMA